MCKCCDEIEFIKNYLTIPEKIKHKFQAQIVKKSYKKNQRKPSGIIHFSSYDLNYCPMCGRKLTK